MAVHIRKRSDISTNVRILKLRRFATHFILTLCWYLRPAWAVALVKRHVFRPAGYRTRAEENQFLGSGSKFQIDIHGKTVQGWKWGEGPGVLFVHGWNGRGIQFHRFFTPLIDAGFAPITFDAPAHGESSGKTSSYFEWTDTVRALLNSKNELNINAIVGHSLGGSAVINALYNEKISVPTVLLAPVFKLQEILFNTFSHYGIPAYVYRKAIEEYEHRFGYTLKNANPCNLLPTVDTEFLVIHDRQDQAIPFQDSVEMAAAWPHVILHETTGLGHRRILSDREIVEFTTKYLIGRMETPEIPQLGFEQHPEAGYQYGKISAAM